MIEEEIKNTFIELMNNLKVSIHNLQIRKNQIEQELKKYHSEITINELQKTLPAILEKVQKWYEIYNNTHDLLNIDVNEYSFVLKEYAYISGECTLVDDLNTEVIDWQIGNIGYQMKKELKERNESNE